MSFYFRSTAHQKELFVFVICAIELFVIIMLNVSIVYLYFVNKQKIQNSKSPRSQTAEVSSQKLLEQFRMSSSVILGDIFCHVIISQSKFGIYTWKTSQLCPCRFILTSHQNYATYTKMIVFLTSLNVVGVEPILLL